MTRRSPFPERPPSDRDPARCPASGAPAIGRLRATLLPVLVALAATSAAARAQGADLCVNAVDLGVGATQAAFDTALCSDTGAPATTEVLVPQPCSVLGFDVWFQWTASRTGPARFSTCGANFDSKLGLWRGGVCGALVPLACNDDRCALQAEVTLNAVAGERYTIQLGYFTTSPPSQGSPHGAGTLVITELGPVPNDTCATATVFPPGVAALPFDTAGASNSGFGGAAPCVPPTGPDVFFEWTAPAAGNYEFRTCGSAGDTVLAVYQGAGCAAVCAARNDDACGIQSFVQRLGVQAGEVFLVQVSGFLGAAPSGQLTIASFNPPACAVNDDAFEPNDDCAAAAPVLDADYPGLVCRDDDPDFYRIDIAPGEELVVAALFIDNLADIDLYLWGAAATPCGVAAAGPGPSNGSLRSALTTTDNEVITYANTTGAVETVLVEVDVFAPGTQACVEYTLVVRRSSQTNTGFPFCDGVTPNSSGAPAILWVNQAGSVGSPSMVLTVAPLPFQAVGFLLASRGTTGGFPISAGRLCLDPATLVRFQQAPISSGNISYVSFVFPWQLSPVVLLPGETWHFQFWHRDSSGGLPVANFSRGLSLRFL